MGGNAGVVLVAAEVPFGGYSGQGFSLRGEKGRYVLPPKFRKDVAQSSDGKVLCVGIDENLKCLTGFGLSRRAQLMDQVNREESQAIQRGQDFDRTARMSELYGFAEIPFDASGRFVLPDYLAELAGLDDALYFQGAGDFFTLWNPQELYRVENGWVAAKAACSQLEREARAKAKKP